MDNIKTDHVKMLYDIAELNSLFSQSISIQSFLEKIVRMVADHMDAEVCSIYLYNEAEQKLVLKATVGLEAGSVDKVKLKLGEGLVGLSMREIIPVCEKCGTENPHFKFYPETGEDKFQSFLAVPIVRGAIRIGVLVVQRAEGRTFHEQDVLALRATASQLASMIENIKYIISPEEKKPVYTSISDITKIKLIKGKSASSGTAYNEAVVLSRERSLRISESPSIEADLSIEDFDSALINTEYQLVELQKRVEEKLEDAASLIFSAHLLMLKDFSFTGEIRKMIVNGEKPINAVIKKYREYSSIFLNSPSQIIREKAQDIEDLTSRIIDNMLGEEKFTGRYNNRIVIARDVLPSEILAMSAEGVTGIVMVSGGVTAHIAILARSLGLPVITVDKPELLSIPEGVMILIDAELGNIYINPAKEITESYLHKRKTDIASQELLAGPSNTKDGIKINIMVNINLLSDLKNLEGIEIEGIGLYRTEFPFIIRSGFPSEEEQYFVYRKLVERMRNKPVVFRTLDIGGDKVLSYYETAKEDNPFLGMRSIRFSLRHKDIFKEQIRAILRAGFDSEIKIMFPMISSLDEFLASKEVVLECSAELETERVAFKKNPEIGMMVEIPSVVNIIEDLAAEARFFSIGTNDLIQYTLAVDRTNGKIADMYVAHHPSILRSLKIIADAGNRHGVEVTVCGDMANDIRYIPFLIGIGIKTLSVDATYILKVKKAVSEISVKEAEKKAAMMLSMGTISEIDKIVDGN
jgi:phosphotransferase system, enzyme I, PtsP